MTVLFPVVPDLNTVLGSGHHVHSVCFPQVQFSAVRAQLAQKISCFVVRRWNLGQSSFYWAFQQQRFYVVILKRWGVNERNTWSLVRLSLSLMCWVTILSISSLSMGYWASWKHRKQQVGSINTHTDRYQYTQWIPHLTAQQLIQQNTGKRLNVSRS